MEVFIIAALSLDGFLGRSADHSSITWRSKEDSEFFMQKTREVGAVVMGSTTFSTMRRPMPGRKHYVLTSNPQQYSSLDANQVVGLNIQPQEVVELARKDGYSQLAVCGGSSVYTQFMQAGLIDTLYLTIEPVLFGQGIKLFNDTLDIKLRLIQTHHLSDQTIVQELAVVE